MNYKTKESPCTLTTIGSTGLVYRKTWIKSVERLQVKLKKVYFLSNIGEFHQKGAALAKRMVEWTQRVAGIMFILDLF